MAERRNLALRFGELFLERGNQRARGRQVVDGGNVRAARADSITAVYERTRAAAYAAAGSVPARVTTDGDACAALGMASAAAAPAESVAGSENERSVNRRGR